MPPSIVTAVTVPEGQTQQIAEVPSGRGQGIKGADWDAVLGELESGAAAAPPKTPPAKAAPATPAAEEPADGLGEPIDDAESVDGEEEVEGAPDPAESTPPAAEEAALDPEAHKRIVGLQRAERQMRERINKERAAFEQERERFVAEWRPKIEAAEKFEQARARARYAPDAVLEAAGLGPDDYERAAQILYAKSKAGAANPQTRAAAERLAREAEANDALAQTRRELAELKQTISKRDEEAANARRAEEYLGSVTKAATTGAFVDPDTRMTVKVDAPIVKKMLATSPARAKERLGQVAYGLLQRDGVVPSPAEVVAELERVRREELAEVGIDPATVIGAKAAPAPETPAAKAAPPRTLRKAGGSVGAPPPREKARSRDEEFELLRKELESNSLNPQ